MLVDVEFNRPDFAISFTASLRGSPATPQRVQRGVYLAGHWNVGDMIRGGVRDRWGEDVYSKPPFLTGGVCDSFEQLLSRVSLESAEEKVCVSLVKIAKADQPPLDGWRWHKWGEYIGDHAIEYEYLYDEKGVEQVFTFCVHEMPVNPA